MVELIKNYTIFNVRGDKQRAMSNRVVARHLNLPRRASIQRRILRQIVSRRLESLGLNPTPIATARIAH